MMARNSCLLGLLFQSFMIAQPSRQDGFLTQINEIVNDLPGPHSGGFVAPSEDELRDWVLVLSHYRLREYDSCKIILAKYNYSLSQYRDDLTGNLYDIVRESSPIQRGWGTFILNRNFRKRIYVHVNHPLDDGNAAVVGAEMFRRLGARGLLIAGTSKLASGASSDMTTARQSVFQRWHEMLAELTHITLSIHGFSSSFYPDPIRTTDVVISNGRTSDDQWGISQLSLGFRDSVRGSGLSSALAMYDSGFARLSGSTNAQGIFSNDSLGFGHWLNIELSANVRYNPSHYLKLITAANSALELTGKRVSQQLNRVFGLVSPRVLRVDSVGAIMFPPGGRDYSIIAFGAPNDRADSTDPAFGSWIDFQGGRQAKTRVTRIGSTRNQLTQLVEQFGTSQAGPQRSAIASHLDESRKAAAGHAPKSEDQEVGAEEEVGEPLQVHRIPIRPLVTSTIVTGTSPATATFTWGGIVDRRFPSRLDFFTFGTATPLEPEILPNMFIPLLTNSYRPGEPNVIGIEMSSMLINEIARLVDEHRLTVNDVGLLAEQSETGDYFLRVFPARDTQRDQPR